MWPCIGRGVALQTGDWSRAPDMCPPPPPPRPSSAELSIAQQQQTELCRYLQEISVSGRLHQSGNQLGTCGAWPGAFVPRIRTERDIESGISEKPVICHPKSQPIIIYLPMLHPICQSLKMVQYCNTLQCVCTSHCEFECLSTTAHMYAFINVLLLLH